MRGTHLALWPLALVLSVALAACGDGSNPGVTAATTPLWAQTSAEQIAEARRWGLPAAFENSEGLRFVIVPQVAVSHANPGREPVAEDAVGGAASSALFIQMTEVSRADFQRWPGSRDIEDHSDGAESGALPRDSVTWDEAIAFAAWLDGIDTNYAYSVPTEEQWRRVLALDCPSDRSQRWVQARANLFDLSAASALADEVGEDHGKGGFAWDDGHSGASPVGTYLPGQLGVFDIIGNMAEWCLDLYGSGSSGSRNPKLAAPGSLLPAEIPFRGGMRVVMGADYSEAPPLARARTARMGLNANMRLPMVGFRVVAMPRTAPHSAPPAR